MSIAFIRVNSSPPKLFRLLTAIATWRSNFLDINFPMPDDTAFRDRNSIPLLNDFNLTGWLDAKPAPLTPRVLRTEYIALPSLSIFVNREK